ncbi:acyltransferase family protein [Pseudomonas sp. Marseille-QA0892]
MPTYRGLEGARAWLAWIVVLTHIVALTGIAEAIPAMRVIGKCGDWAVQVFIIMSGFVITHLLLSRQESYPLYIARRALRLFPAYLVALLLAILALPATISAFGALPWHDAGQLIHFADQQAQLNDGNLTWHVVLHALMLHGAVPNSLLPESEYMFLTPAWSVSLEWQFYLLAPFLLRMLLNDRLKILFIAGAVASYIAYRAGLFGQFYLPSLLPGSIGYFLVGIGTRLALDRLPALRSYPLILVAGCLILAIGSGELVPLAAWIGLMSYAQLDREALEQPDLATRLLKMVLDSRFAVSAGLRSYSVYILHWVVISIMMCLATLSTTTSPWLQFAEIFVGTVAVTIIGSECLYRFVERPGIEFGRALARRPEPGTECPSQRLAIR